MRVSVHLVYVFQPTSRASNQVESCAYMCWGRTDALDTPDTHTSRPKSPLHGKHARTRTHRERLTENGHKEPRDRVWTETGLCAVGEWTPPGRTGRSPRRPKGPRWRLCAFGGQRDGRGPVGCRTWPACVVGSTCRFDVSKVTGASVRCT